MNNLGLSRVCGYNPGQIGEVMMVQGLSMMAAAPLVGRLARIVELRLMMAFGLVLVALRCWGNGRLTVDWGFQEYIGPQVLRGFGLVCCFIPLTNLSLGTLPLAQVRNASALYNVMRNLGGAIGLASLTTLMNQRTWLHWQQLAESTRLSRRRHGSRRPESAIMTATKLPRGLPCCPKKNACCRGRSLPRRCATRSTTCFRTT